MQDSKHQKCGDIVSPGKKFQFCEIFYNTAEINLSMIQFIELEIHSFVQISKTERRGSWNATHSQCYVSVCQMSFHLPNQVRRHDQEDHWMPCKSLTEGRSRVQAWSLRGQPSLTAEKYRVLTLRCTHVSVWRATVQCLLDKAKEWSVYDSLQSLR